MDPQKIKERIIQDLSDQIPDLIEGENDFILNRLTSRKNIVFELIFKIKPAHFPKIVVLKLFQTEFAEREYQMLKLLEQQQTLVPKVLFYRKPYILMEKIQGINLTNFINNNLKNISSLNDLKLHIRRKLKHSVKKLARWFAIFHKNNIIRRTENDVIVVNKGDARLRDFIYNPATHDVYGLDFEEAYEGNYHDDLAWICCALLDTNPGIFESKEPRPKIELIKVFLKKYYKINNDFKFSFNYFAERLIENLNIIIERRDLEFGSVRKETILNNLANLI
ncbi:MAG: serine/threonine protein kinase [Candidatus Lokiarchaeota archaeon]|nr:serine/threonine protein kinase [Candidatus Lokiarchaeota archaeon]